jgi:glycosyltransferase involved in cell wall biosynthesis
MTRSPSPRLSVLVNAVSARTGGGLTYAFEQIRELAAVEDLELSVLATQPLARRLGTACPGLRVRAQRRLPLVLRVVWEQAAIPLLARDHDVVYMLGNFAAFAYRGPQAVALQNPNHFGATARAIRAAVPSRRHRMRLALEAAVARASVTAATRTIAVSETLRAAVEEDVGHARGLRTIPSGVPELPRGLERTRERRYVLAVANDYPHKEWDSMLSTFAREPGLPPLVVAGACRTGRRQRELEDLIARLPTGKISLVGAVEDRAAMAELYREALCLVAHSRLEAFPLTPYEAWSMGVPVAATDIAAHREACGPRAFYYDPDVPGSLARAVRDATGSAPSGAVAGLTSWRENAAAVAALLRETAATR